MRRTICAGLATMIVLAGCAGREAMPVRVRQMDDNRRSIQALEAEMEQIDQEILRKRQKRKSTAAANVVYGVTGFFFLVPWFFMDFKDAEGTEVEALTQRKAWLTSVMEDKAASGTATEPIQGTATKPTQGLAPEPTQKPSKPAFDARRLKQPSEF